LKAKIAAGCDAVQIFDTWAGLLGPADLDEFSLRYIARICDGLKDSGVPIIVFAKGVHDVEKMQPLACDVIGVDWTMDLGSTRKVLGNTKALQGNLDPCVLFAPQAKIRKEVERVLAGYGHGPGHIFNLGHGILPNTSPENAKYLVSCVKELSIKYHENHANDRQAAGY